MHFRHVLIWSALLSLYFFGVQQFQQDQPTPALQDMPSWAELPDNASSSVFKGMRLGGGQDCSSLPFMGFGFPRQEGVQASRTMSFNVQSPQVDGGLQSSRQTSFKIQQSPRSFHPPSQSGVLPSRSGLLPSQSGVLPSQSGVLPSQSGLLQAQGIESVPEPDAHAQVLLVPIHEDVRFRVPVSQASPHA